jgi:cytochrome c-type biogenesis protein CcmH
VIPLIVACAALLILAIAAIAWPLLRGARTPVGRDQFDRAVYRDQLDEIDRDLARGVLDQSEADAARLEVQRRLLGVRGDGEDAMSGKPSPAVAAFTAILVAGSALGLYLILGAPELPDMPFAVAQAQSAAAAGQQAPAHDDFRAAAAKMREKLQSDPDNAAAWELYARTESRIGEYQNAADAYRHAIDLGRKTPKALDGYAEMLVIAAQGIVPPAAADTFGEVVRMDPGNPVARFYLALADAQAGEARKAVDEWVKLAADLPNDDGMREEIGNRIAAAAQSGGFEPPKLPAGRASPPPDASGNPTSEQMQAAAGMSQADRDKMIQTMIDQLAARLAREPNDVAGWGKLAQAYAVQGKTDKAVDALDRASALKPDDPTIKLEEVAVLLAPLQPADPIPPKAIALLHEVSAVAPDAPEVLWYLGIVDARQGRPDEARKNWTKLIGDLEEGSQDRKMVQSALDQLGAGQTP